MVFACGWPGRLHEKVCKNSDFRMRVLHPHAKLLFSQVVAYVGRMPASCPLLPLREEACHRRIWAGGGEPPLPSAPTTAVPAVRSRQEEARRCWIRAGGGKSPSRKPPPSAPTAAAPTAEPPTALATVARYGQEEACRPTSTTAVASLSSAVAASGGGCGWSWSPPRRRRHHRQ